MTTPPHSPDTGQIVGALTARAAAYLLAGDIAAQAWGASVEAHVVDVIARADGTNLTRVALALHDIGARVRVGGLPVDIEPMGPVDANWLAMLGTSTWATDHGDIDIALHEHHRDGSTPGYDALVDQSIDIDVGGQFAQVIGLNDLIASTRWTDRPGVRTELDAIRRQLDRDTGLDPS